MNNRLIIVIGIIAALIIGGGLGYLAVKDTPLWGKTVVQINGKSFTMKDIDRQIGKMPPALQVAFQDAEGKRRFVENLVKGELLLQEARRRGLDRGPEIQEKLDEYRQSLALKALLKDLESKIQVTDEELNSYLRSRSEQVNVRHILVATEKEARELRERIRRGESFEKLAKIYSLDKGSRDQGGELGFFSRGQTNSPFEDAAFKLQAGQISEPVKTEYGYHLIKMVGHRQLQMKDLETIRERVRESLSEEKQEQVLNKLLEDLRAKIKVKIREEAFMTESSYKGKAESETGKTKPGAK